MQVSLFTTEYHHVVHHYLLQAISICNLATLPCSSDKTTTSRSDPAIDLDAGRPCPRFDEAEWRRHLALSP
jgi:hypothetical protein